jgi:peptidoglycan glycosyltransferase
MHIRTTIDLALQKVLDNALGQANGAAVALDPKTGAVLALVSHPFFDPNLLITPGEAADTYWEQLKQDTEAPLVNRSTQGLYAPGSTFKTVTLAAALEAGAATPTTQFSYPLQPPDGNHPVSWHENQYVSCENHTQTQFDLNHAYAYSCNVASSELGLKIGPDTYVKFARAFGLESEPPLDIETETSRLFHTKNYFSGDERFYALGSTAMGQGELAVTPLQMALIAAAIANDGVVPAPYLVEEVRDGKGSVLWQKKPQAWLRAISPATARLVAEAMVVGVEDGWAATAKVKGVKVAGKTGSAQVGQTGKPHSWFIGFAPADNPKVAIAVIKEFGGYGSEEVAPVARAAFEAALKDR